MRELPSVVPGFAVVLFGDGFSQPGLIRARFSETTLVGMRSIEYRLDTATDETRLMAMAAAATPTFLLAPVLTGCLLISLAGFILVQLREMRHN